MFVRLVSDIYDVCVGRWAENSIPPIQDYHFHGSVIDKSLQLK